MATLNQFGLRDLQGEQLGHLKVLQRAKNRPVKGKIFWQCQCVCGKVIVVRHDYLLHTNSPKRSCGCIYKKEPTVESENKEEYRIWRMMHIRCKDPRHVSYASYGGRGITVCDRWNSFANFLADIGKRPNRDHSLDRQDSNGNYEPGNVVWATATAQARNKRKSLFLPHPQTGVTVPAAEVAEFFGISYQQLRYRYKKEGKWPT